MIISFWALRPFDMRPLRLSRNVGPQSLSDAASHPRRIETITTPLRKPKNSRMFISICLSVCLSLSHEAKPVLNGTPKNLNIYSFRPSFRLTQALLNNKLVYNKKHLSLYSTEYLHIETALMWRNKIAWILPRLYRRVVYDSQIKQCLFN